MPGIERKINHAWSSTTTRTFCNRYMQSPAFERGWLLQLVELRLRRFARDPRPEGQLQAGAGMPRLSGPSSGQGGGPAGHKGLRRVFDVWQCHGHVQLHDRLHRRDGPVWGMLSNRSGRDRQTRQPRELWLPSFDRTPACRYWPHEGGVIFPPMQKPRSVGCAAGRAASRTHRDVRSSPAGAEAKATSARRCAIHSLSGTWRPTLVRARCASGRAARGLHVREDCAFRA
jgi:hypothetical protein